MAASPKNPIGEEAPAEAAAMPSRHFAMKPAMGGRPTSARADRRKARNVAGIPKPQPRMSNRNLRPDWHRMAPAQK